MSDTIWQAMQVPDRFNTGQIVFSDNSRGRVSMVSERWFLVIWDDGNGDAVVYPTGFQNIRPAFPWE